MSQTFNNEFATRIDAPSLEPRFVVRLSFDRDDTDFVYLTSHDDTDLPDNITAIKGCLQPITGVSQKINPDKANSTIGAMNIKAVDLNGELSDLIAAKREAGFGLRHKKVLAYVGFKDLAWEDFERQRTFIVESLTIKDGLVSLKTEDIQRQTRKTIFNVKQTTLAKPVDATQTHIPCTARSLSAFPVVLHDDSYSAHPNQSVAYIQIDDEIIAHTGLFNHPTDGTSFQVLQRGALNTRSAAHDADEGKSEDRRTEIKEVVYIEGVALKVAYALLTGVLYGQSDNLPSHWHLGIDTTLVRLSDWEAAGSDLWDTATNTGKIVRFIGVEGQDGKAFIEKEILLWTGAFMPVYSDGTLGFKRMRGILNDAPTIRTLNEASVVSYGAVTEDMKSVINTLEINWNYDHVQGRYTKVNRLIDADSIIQHDDGNFKKITFRGVATGRHTDEEVRGYLNVLRDRYSGPPLRLRASVLPRHSDLEVGDVVKISLPNMTDSATGKAINRAFEIQSISTDWATGNLRLDLFASSQRATLIPLADEFVMEDSFYTSEGTDLATVLSIANGVVQADGAITSNGSGFSVFYFDGDLEIPDGITVTFSGNVELRVKGALTQNGIIDGRGNSLGAGRLGTSTKAINSVDVVYCRSGRSVAYHAKDNGQNVAVNGEGIGLGFLSLLNQNGTDISGDESILDGVSGISGDTVKSIYADISGNAIKTSTISNIDVPSPPALNGLGGAGIKLIARGYSLGPNAVIDTSGADSTPPTLSTFYGSPALTNNSRLAVYPSSGGGGAAGGFLYLIDGNSTPPDIISKRVAKNGDSKAPDNPNYYPENTSGLSLSRRYLFGIEHGYSTDAMRDIINGRPIPRLDGYSRHFMTSGRYRRDSFPFDNLPIYQNNVNWSSQATGSTRQGQDFTESMTHFQYIPPRGSTDEIIGDAVHVLPEPQNLQLFTGTPEVIYASDGTPIAHIRATWDAINDPDLMHYELQEKRCALSNWQVFALVSPTASPEARFIVQPSEAYEVRIRAVSINQDGHSDFVVSQCLTAEGDTQPPPPVQNLSVENTQRQLIDWSFISLVDIAGYKIRYVDGQMADWSGATPFFDGYITYKPYDAGFDLEGKTVLIKAIDTSGNESAASTYFVAVTNPLTTAEISHAVAYSDTGAAVTMGSGSLYLAAHEADAYNEDGISQQLPANVLTIAAAPESGYSTTGNSDQLASSQLSQASANESSYNNSGNSPTLSSSQLGKAVSTEESYTNIGQSLTI